MEPIIVNLGPSSFEPDRATYRLCQMIAGSKSTTCLLRAIFWSIAFVVMFVTTSHAGSLEDAEAAYKRQDYEAAVQLWRPLAIQGDPIAQLRLGWMYRLGLGVKPDQDAPPYWWRLSANQENSDAQVALGAMYEFGEGEPIDLDRAAYWYLRAASHNNSRGQLNIGMFYMTGTGVPIDRVLAFKWLTLAIASADSIPAGQAPSAEFIRKVAGAKLDQLIPEMSAEELRGGSNLVHSWHSE